MIWRHFSRLVTHATDLHLLLGFRTAPEATPPPIEHDFANEMKDIWINFVNDLNPGGMSPHTSFKSSLVPTSHARKLAAIR